jgi:LysR family transcriptional regulator, low CO2-responsive transcriptional regulator
MKRYLAYTTYKLELIAQRCAAAVQWLLAILLEQMCCLCAASPRTNNTSAQKEPDRGYRKGTMMFTLDLYRLQMFMQVAQAGSFSRAAEQLLMSQAGVSQHIKLLEDGLGVPLFERDRRGVRLTAAGQKLFEYTESIFLMVAAAELAVTDVRGLREGSLQIGVTPGLSTYLLPSWLQEFGQHYPNLSISVQTAITPLIIRDLRGGKLDLAVIEGELDTGMSEKLRIQPLQEFDQFVIIGQRHPWWERQSIAIEELNEQPMVTRQVVSQTRIWLDQILREQQISPRLIAELDNPESIKRMVMLGNGLTIMPIYAVRAEIDLGMLRAIPLSGTPLRRTLRLVQRSARPTGPIAQAFLHFLQQQFS